MTTFNQSNQRVTGNQFNSGDSTAAYKQRLIKRLEQTYAPLLDKAIEAIDQKDRANADLYEAQADCYRKVRDWIINGDI